MAIHGLPLERPAPPQPPTPIEWMRVSVSRGGVELLLDEGAATGWIIMPGVQGVSTPATALLEQRAAGQWGSYRTGVDVPAREVFFPLHLQTGGHSELLAELDRFHALTSPYSDEPVRLTVQRPGGHERSIEGFRTSAPQTQDASTWQPTAGWAAVELTLTCPDPWWRGSPRTWSWEQGVQPSFFDPRGNNTFLPLILAADRLLGEPVVVPVPGDVPASPRWIVTGPASSVSATHVESGRSWTVNAALGVGETLTVDTDPRVAATTGLSVVGPAGEDWFEYLEPPFDLWPLPVGEQSVTVGLAGSSAGSSAALEITPLHETA